MATKEDILEQIVEEYLLHKGYFVKHNLKFLPRKNHPDYCSIKDSNHSDIDVLGYHPVLSGADQVWAVSCKSWQAGFAPETKIAQINDMKTVGGREAWKGFRELVSPKWSEAFRQTIEKSTGSKSFTYVTAVAKVRGNPKVWENHQPFIDALNGNPLKVLSFTDMIKDMQNSQSTTLASSEVGRLLQMFHAAGIELRTGG